MADYKNLHVAGNVLVSNDITVSGDLNVLGTTTTITSSTVAITDKDLVLAKDNTTDASADGAGIIIKAATDKTFLYDYNGGSDKFVTSIALDVTGAITGATVATTGSITAGTGGFVGDGANITNISATGISAPGNDTEVLINNSGSFGSDTELTYNSTTNTLSTGALTLSGALNANSATLTTALPIASGGTGGATALDARNNLGLGATDNPTFANLTVTDITASGDATITGDTTVTGDISGAGITASGDLTISGTGTSTFAGDVTVTGNLTANGSLSFADEIIQVGTGSSNTSALGLKVDKGTGSRTAYFTWSKTNNRWDAYYSDQANAGPPFVKTVINADIVGNLTGDVTGNVTGNLTGDVTGNVTGNLTGNVTGTVSDISNHTTDALSEGSTNIYYTDERVDDRVSTLIVAGANMTATYDDTANTLTLASTATGSGYDLTGNDTDDLGEGSTNLYFTDARAITAITSNDLDMGGRKVLFGNMYAAEGNLPSATTYHGMFAHVHGTGKGYFAHGGNWIKLLDETSSTTDNLTEGTTNLYYTTARANTDFDTQLATKTTTNLAEGTNLYYTDARARAVSIENVVEDTDPDLGGNLDLNSNNIEGSGNIDITGNIDAVGNLDISGTASIGNKLTLGTVAGATGAAGEIRWSGTDFLGYDGSGWLSFTAPTVTQNSLQTANFTSSQNTTSTSFADVPGYTTSITTTQANSNLRVSLNITRSGDEGAIKLVRTIGATNVDVIEIPFQTGDGNFTNAIIDSPSATAGTVVTYKLQHKIQSSGTAYINFTTTNNQINIEEITATPIAVDSVNGASGTVVLDLEDMDNVDNTGEVDGSALIKSGTDYVASSNNTGAMIMPVGTTAQRPSSPVQGMVRFNSDTTKFEGYNGTDWINLVEENWGSLT